MTNRKLLSVEDVNNILGEHKETLEEYIKLYITKSVDPITTHIYIVSSGDDVYKELLEEKARGVCHTEDGFIYFRNDTDLTAHLLVHEFIHRLSRNRLLVIGKLSRCWVEGINYSKGAKYMNEVITEMITSDITGMEEADNPYTLGLDIIRQFAEKVGKEELIRAYFESDIHFLKQHLKKNYKPFVNHFYALIHFYIKAISSSNRKEYMNHVKDAAFILNLIVDSL